MEFLGMENEKGEPVELVVHSNIFLYERNDDQPSAIQEACCHLFDEGCNQLVANPICGGFEEYFSPPIYDKYENIYSEDEGPKCDVSSCSSNSEFLCQEELISLDFIEYIPCEMHERNQVLKFDILNEVVDVSFTICHEHFLHGYFEEQFDKVLVEVQSEQQYWCKQMT